MRTKREITITFVTDDEGPRVFAAIDAVSRIMDRVTITSRLLSPRPEQPARERRQQSVSQKPREASEPLSNEPQLVYSADPLEPHKRNIDVEASLKKLCLTREQLASRRWPRGSPQHRLKGAAARAASAAVGHATRGNGKNGVSAAATR